MRKYLVMVIALVLAFSLSIDSFAAALPGPPSKITITSDIDQWTLNGSSIATTHPNDTSWRGTWYDFSSLPSSADVHIMFKGLDDTGTPVHFLGGQAYQFYWDGSFYGQSTLFSPVGDLSDSGSSGSIDATVYSISLDGNTYEYISADTDADTITISVNGVHKVYSADSNVYPSYLRWWVDQYGNLWLAYDRPISSGNSIFIIQSSSTPKYGIFALERHPYDNLNSITLSFPDVTGSTSGGYEFTVPTSNFSWYDGKYSLNAIVSIPAGTDCEDYFHVRFNFSSPSSGPVSSIVFTVDGLSYGGMGQVDAAVGELQDISNQLTELAKSLEGLAQDSTVAKCLDAIRSIYSFLSGNVLPLLQQIEVNQDTLYAFLSSNMLPQIVAQLGNIKASIDTGFDNTVAAIQAQTEALISYLDNAFQNAGTDIQDTNEQLEGAIGSFDQSEGALVDDFNAKWSAFDFNAFVVDATLGNAFTWVSARFVDLWNAVGGEVQLLVTIPCVLGIGLMIVTGSSRFLGRPSRSRDESAE